MAGLSCARPLAPRRASLAPRHATVAPPRSQSVSPRRLAVSASAPGPGGDAESRPDVAPPMAVTRRAAALAGFALVASAAFNPAATAIPVAPLGKPGVYSTEAKALGLSDWALAHGASYESLSSPLECRLSSLAPADAGIAVLSMDLRLRRALINPAGCVGPDATCVRLSVPRASVPLVSPPRRRFSPHASCRRRTGRRMRGLRVRRFFSYIKEHRFPFPHATPHGADPVTRITGLRRYMKAASLLFDISESKGERLEGSLFCCPRTQGFFADCCASLLSRAQSTCCPAWSPPHARSRRRCVCEFKTVT